VLNRVVDNNSRYINLGAWFKDPHFAVWDGEELKVEKLAI